MKELTWHLDVRGEGREYDDMINAGPVASCLSLPLAVFDTAKWF